MAHLIKFDDRLHSMERSTRVEGDRCDTCLEVIIVGYVNNDSRVTGVSLTMCRGCVMRYER